jgi:FdrA protein
VAKLEAAGARVETSNDVAIQYVGRLLESLSPTPAAEYPASIDPSVLRQPLSAINVGLESFTESLLAQGASVIQVDWKPPAGGDEHLMAILQRMKGK